MRLWSLITAHDAAGRAASFPRCSIDIQVYAPRHQRILHSPVLRGIHCSHTRCAYFPPLLLLFLRVDVSDARVLRPIPDARGAHLAAKRVPVFRACVPRLPRRLSLQTLSSPSVFRAARTRQQRGPHRDRSVRHMGGSDLLGSAPNGHPE